MPATTSRARHSRAASATMLAGSPMRISTTGCSSGPSTGISLTRDRRMKRLYPLGLDLGRYGERHFRADDGKGWQHGDDPVPIRAVSKDLTGEERRVGLLAPVGRDHDDVWHGTKMP